MEIGRKYIYTYFSKSHFLCWLCVHGPLGKSLMSGEVSALFLLPFLCKRKWNSLTQSPNKSLVGNRDIITSATSSWGGSFCCISPVLQLCARCRHHLPCSREGGVSVLCCIGTSHDRGYLCANVLEGWLRYSRGFAILPRVPLVLLLYLLQQ